MTSRPRISVVVPTYNRWERLRRVLRALSAQTVDAGQFDAVVVSDGSTDGTDDLVRRMSTPYGLTFVTQANSGPAAARNTGVRLACAELVLFLDDDVVPSPELVEQHLAAHERDEGKLVVVGPMLNPPRYRPSVVVRWEQAMLYKQYDALRRGDFVPTYRQFFTGNASLSRARCVEAGGFDERYRRAEDIELAYRLGLGGAEFVFNEKAVGYHFAERPFHAWITNARAYGSNDVIFDREGRDTTRLQAARWEYSRRHPVTRSLARVCVGRSGLEHALQWSVRAILAVGDPLKLDGVMMPALSGLYNTTYYCGMAEELGGPVLFRRFMEEGDTSAGEAE